MDKRAFKQRMQNLKSYRENNPGKGYWDWKVETFADGGEVGDPEKERFYQATGRSSSGRPLEEGLKPVFSLLANHEMNHYTDYIISRNANTTINNNMLKQLENSLKQTDATSYYRKGTEQKAYMNQLRTMLKQNADVQNLDEPVSSTLLKKYLDKMSDSDPIKKMFKQHKNINAYTKWFNTIPLLGTTALGANAYFNNNKDE